MKKMVGHTLLAKLGKKRLRPGGKKATNWLLKQVDLNHKSILEVACNMGTTSLELSRKYTTHITAIDLDEEALSIAQKRKQKSKVKGTLEFLHKDALQLDFEHGSFDIVINEAMLTMLPQTKKEIAVLNYYDALKKDGILLTHDVCLLTNDEKLQKEIIAALSRAINIHVTPKTVDGWIDLFKERGFKDITYLSGPMSLLNPVGMIKDEGIFNTLKIIKNAMKKENKPQFQAMYHVFKKYKNELGFIAVASKK